MQQHDPKAAMANVKTRFVLASLPGPLLLIGAVIITLVRSKDEFAGQGGLLAFYLGCQIVVAVLYVLLPFVQWLSPLGWAWNIGLLTFMSGWFAVQFTWTLLPTDFALTYLAIGFGTALVLALSTGLIAAGARKLLVSQPQSPYLNTKLELLFLAPDGKFITVSAKSLCPSRRRIGRPKLRVRLESITGAEIVDGSAVKVLTYDQRLDLATQRPDDLLEVIRRRCAERQRKLAKTQS